MKKILTLLFALLMLVGCSQSGDNQVPDNMQLASREDVTYCLYVPKTWNVNTDSGVSSAYYSTGDSANVSVMSYYLEAESMSIDDYWKLTEEAYQTNFQGYTLSSTETTLLGGRKAGQYTFDLTIDGESVRMMQIVAAYQSMFYIFTYTASPETFENHLDEVQTIVDNFTFR